MTKELLGLSFVVLFGFTTGICLAKYSGGDGTPATPYRIFDANDMNNIGLHDEDWGSHFVMVNDVNLSEFTGTQFNIIGYFNNSVDNEPFTGVFDGNGHSISNFTYESTGTSYIGLFGYVDDANAEIKDLTLIDPNVDAGTGDYVGSLVGNIEEGTISGCGSKGASVAGDARVGGLVGVIGFANYAPWHGGSIIVINCYANANTSGNNVVGGLAGGSYGGTIIGSYSTGTVSGDHAEVGGLVGANYDADIFNSYSTASITGDYSVGGLVGKTFKKYRGAEISNCYAIGSVSGYHLTGGLVGYNWPDVTVSNCYSTSSVTGDEKVGGLVGYNFGTISNCYAVGDINGITDVGGLVGENDGTVTACFWDTQRFGLLNGVGDGSSSGVTGKTTSEMQTESTFTSAGWDFVEIWNIGENQTYPFLRVYPAGDSNHDGRVDGRDLAIIADRWLYGI